MGKLLTSSVGRLAAVLSGIVLSACISNTTEFHRAGEAGEACINDTANRCFDRDIQVNLVDPGNPAAGKYSLGFIQYDDQGEPFRPGQLDDVIRHARKLVDESEARDILMVLYVHGWMHNPRDHADPGKADSDVVAFKGLLSEVARSETATAGGAPRPVMGFYLGWRGLSIKLPFLRRATFWTRKSTAHRVGHSGASEAIARISELRNQLNREDARQVQTGQRRDNNKVSRLTLIGHSFGGAVLFSSMQGMLQERVARAHDTALLRGQLADLVVLMNPAFEASRLSNTWNLLERRRVSISERRVSFPSLVVLTSKTDWATKYAFPIGRFTSTFLKSYNNDQRKRDRRTLGHYEPYVTHKMWPTDPAYDREENDNGKCVQFGNARLAADGSVVKREAAARGSSDSAGLEFPGIRLVLNSQDDPVKQEALKRVSSVVWVAQVDKNLMNGHNDIKDCRIKQFINIVISAADRQN